MKCRFNNIARLYSNNMLDDGEINRFEAHLRECDECAAVVEEESRIASMYRNIAAAKPPARLDEGIFNSLKHRKAPYRAARNETNLIFMRRVIPAAAIIAAAMLLVIIFSPQTSGNRTAAPANVNYASVYVPAADEQYLIADDGNTSYNSFLSSINR